MIKNDTHFVDIDGTLIKYRNFDEITAVEAVPIQTVIDKINIEYDNGSHIVITSARPEKMRKFTVDELKKLNIKYHQLVLGIGRGVRYLVNDNDPEFPEVSRAVGVNLKRDNGFTTKNDSL